MTNSRLDLKIFVDVEQEVSPQIIDRLTNQLHQEIMRLGVDSVERGSQTNTVKDAKGIAFDWNLLLVGLSSATVLATLIQFLQTWVLRTEGRKIKIRVEKEAIEFEYSPSSTSEEALMDFAEKLQSLLGNNDTIIHHP